MRNLVLGNVSYKPIEIIDTKNGRDYLINTLSRQSIALSRGMWLDSKGNGIHSEEDGTLYKKHMNLVCLEVYSDDYYEYNASTGMDELKTRFIYESEGEEYEFYHWMIYGVYIPNKTYNNPTIEDINHIIDEI